jgi:hypothetical protein
MPWDHYAHPEFGWLSPTRRLRRELRLAFLSVLFGIGLGVAAMIELNDYRNVHDEPTLLGVVKEPPGAIPNTITLQTTTLQTAKTEDELPKDDTRKAAGTAPDTNSKNKTNLTTVCEGRNSSCRGRQIIANDALAIGRVPLGHSDAPVQMTAPPPAEGLERTPETTTSSRAQQPNAGDEAGKPNRADSQRLSPKKPYNVPRSQTSRRGAPNEGRAAYWVDRGYDKPVGQLGRTFAHERSYEQRGFWDWSR